MMYLTCPYCGERSVTEFTYGGDASVSRPREPAAAGDAEWFGYLYQRNNPAGRHREYWHHNLGCRQWLRVERDTITHEVIAADGFAQADDRQP